MKFEEFVLAQGFPGAYSFLPNSIVAAWNSKVAVDGVTTYKSY